jgi:hypothetical protein
MLRGPLRDWSSQRTARIQIRTVVNTNYVASVKNLPFHSLRCCAQVARFFWLSNKRQFVARYKGSTGTEQATIDGSSPDRFDIREQGG